MNIRKQEEEMMAALKTITVKDKNGKEHPVPVIYGNENRLEQFVLGQNITKDTCLPIKDTIRLPVIGVEANAVRRHGMSFHGVVYTMFRDDLNQIIERAFDLDDDVQLLAISRFEISSKTLTGGAEIYCGRFGIVWGS